MFKLKTFNIISKRLSKIAKNRRTSLTDLNFSFARVVAKNTNTKKRVGVEK